MENKKIMYQRRKSSNCYKIKAINNDTCMRCGSKISHNYCLSCEELGAINRGDFLYLEKGNHEGPKYSGKMPEVTLTNQQKLASNFLLNTENDCLIWAVCGAGKTEITFSLIYQMIVNSKLVCFCIPRTDIVNEIYERLEQAFPNIKLSILTGKRKEILDAHVYVMTTNQVLKFYQAFDLIIVDEVDAFPFMHDPKFDYAIKQASKEKSKVVYLTSTPCDKILDKKLETFIISRRWHGYRLPKPWLFFLKFIDNKVNIIIEKYLKISKRQILIFISNINSVEIYNESLKNKGFNSECVHSKKMDREMIVKKFKEEKIDILVTTTILERGVTFKDIDVLVMDSSNPHYTEAALIQIAGRVNRKKEFQNGKVIFFHTGITKEIKQCIKKIKFMNNKKNC